MSQKKKRVISPAKINFKKPPLAEVVFGIQFHSVSDFVVGHVGQLWDKYRREYPVCREQQAIAAPIELMPGEQFTIPIVPTLMPRTVFATSDNSSVIQIQRDAFYYNWQKTNPNIPYPRYEQIVERFEERLNTFIDFLSSNGLGTVTPIQFELTYLNEFPMDIGDIRLLKDSHWESSSHVFLPQPESINLGASFLLPNATGRLHSNFRNLTNAKGESVYQWFFVARGSTSPRSDMALDKVRPWFDNARDWIVQSFADMASDEAQKKLWERIS